MSQYRFGQRLGTESVWNQYKIGTDNPCVYTRHGGSGNERICYLGPNGSTYEGDPIWNSTFPVSSLSRVNRVDPYHNRSDPKRIWTYPIACKRSLRLLNICINFPCEHSCFTLGALLRRSCLKNCFDVVVAILKTKAHPALTSTELNWIHWNTMLCPYGKIFGPQLFWRVDRLKWGPYKKLRPEYFPYGPHSWLITALLHV